MLTYLLQSKSSFFVPKLHYFCFHWVKFIPDIYSVILFITPLTSSLTQHSKWSNMNLIRSSSYFIILIFLLHNIFIFLLLKCPICYLSAYILNGCGAGRCNIFAWLQIFSLLCCTCLNICLYYIQKM